MADELEDLLIDGKDLDRKLLAEILSPYLLIDKERCEIRPLPKWEELKENKKILLYILARKAIYALGLNVPNDNVSAKEIIIGTGLSKGTVNPALRKFYKDRIIGQTTERKYFIPNYSIEKAKTIIFGNQK